MPKAATKTSKQPGKKKGNKSRQATSKKSEETAKMATVSPKAPDAPSTLREKKLDVLVDAARKDRTKTENLLDRLWEIKTDDRPTAKLAPPVKQKRQRRHKTVRGLVEVHPGKPPVRHRILPRTVIGISVMLLAFSVGVAFSGAAFYAYYDYRLAQNEEQVTRFVDEFDQQFDDATGAIDELKVDAVDDIRSELQPLENVVTDAQGVTQFPVSVGESVWTLETKDEEGASVIASAFAVMDTEEGTAFLTSFAAVETATIEPAPGIVLTKGDKQVEARIWSWDVDNDLAIVMIPERVPTLPLATSNEQAQSVGSTVFIVSGVGGQGASASPGRLLDVSEAGLQHTAPVGTVYQGGPVLNGQGNVIGVASLGYQPLGVDPGAVHMAPDTSQFCVQLLNCTDEVEGRPTLNPSSDSDGPIDPETGEPLTEASTADQETESSEEANPTAVTSGSGNEN